MYNTSSLSTNWNYKNNIPEPCTICPACLQTGTTRTTSQNHVRHVQLVCEPELQEQHPRTMYNMSSLFVNRNYKNNIPEPCTTCPAFLQTRTTRTTSHNHVQHIQLVHKPELQEQHPTTMYNMSSLSVNRNYKNNIPEPCTTCPACLWTGTTRTTSQNHVQHVQLVCDPVSWYEPTPLFQGPPGPYFFINIDFLQTKLHYKCWYLIYLNVFNQN